MKILMIGKGGREHALCWKLAQNQNVKEIICISGNAGISAENKTFTEKSNILEFSKKYQPDLIVVGPEDPLAIGIVDKLESLGFNVFGPTQEGAMLETSKSFCKEVLFSENIPTAKSETFSNAEKAIDYVKKISSPLVIKADGLAAGKGVIMCYSTESAIKAIKEMMLDKIFKDAGNKILVEEYLEGEECSIMAFTDGKTIKTMLPSQDHKRLYNNNEGPNTGGMGAYAPYEKLSKSDLQFIEEKILYPTLRGLQKQNISFKGILYAGLMITKDGPKVLEYNTRFGDPETQPLMMLLKSDLVEVMIACIDQTLDSINLEWNEGYSLCVTMVGHEYPYKSSSNIHIKGTDYIEKNKNQVIFHGGTKKVDNLIFTDGGRILYPTTYAASLLEAQRNCYEKLCSKITWEGCHYRTDIAQNSL